MSQGVYGERDAQRIILLESADAGVTWTPVEAPAGGGAADPLTDVQLRATPVPVSGTLTVTPSGTITVALDAPSLAALESITVVDGGGSLTVDGTVAVSNPGLTDTQLRASAVPVSGTLAVTESGTWTVALDATSLAALETINAVQSGTWVVDLGAASLAALEVISVIGNYTEDTASQADPLGIGVLWRRRDTPSATEVTADNDWIAPIATAKGELYVKHLDTIPVTADTELPAAAALSDTDANPTTPTMGAALMGWTSSVWRRLFVRTVEPSSGDPGLVVRQVGVPAAAALADNMANPTTVPLSAYGMAWDGATWDRQTQPLTDAQLRATAVPVSGAVTTTPPALDSDTGLTASLETQVIDGNRVLFVSDPFVRRTNEEILLELRIMNENLALLVSAVGGSPRDLAKEYR